MRTVKIIAGLGCFILALLPGGLALLVFSNFGIPGNIVDFCFALILAALAAGLIYTGNFLIARRNLPIARKAKILVLLPLSCVGVFVAVALPNFIKARSTSCCNACINNLRQIDAAANEFALEKNLRTGDKINFPGDLTPYIKLNTNGNIPPCPQGGIYSIKRVGDTPTCSLGTNIVPAHVLP
jgi:hypothetical protein